MPAQSAEPAQGQASLGTVLREWGRIGCIGFGGPPAHIALLRQLCVERRQWLDAEEFEDAIGACNLLPGPASTELAIFCAWRVRGRLGALAGGLAFIVPGLICILALSALFLTGTPPLWVKGPARSGRRGRRGRGPGRLVSARPQLDAGTCERDRPPAPLGGVPAGRRGRGRDHRPVAGAGPARLRGQRAGHRAGPEPHASKGRAGHGKRRRRRPTRKARGRRRPSRRRYRGRGRYATGPVRAIAALPALGVVRATVAAVAGGGMLASVAWVAFKVGALSFGGGFVIIPLMRADAVGRGWMTSGQFLNAVALGQITPGPVVLTVSAVGYAAAGLGGALLAALVAFSPSFAFVLGGAGYFSRLRTSRRAQWFLDGAGPAAIGAILGSAVLLAGALSQPWQYAVLAAAAVLLLRLRLGVVLTLLAAAVTGLLVALAGGPLPH